MKSVSGITCFVNNVDRTVEFYETLGFTFCKREPDHATAYLNWFWIDFLSKDLETRPDFQADAQLEPKGAGVFIKISAEG